MPLFNPDKITKLISEMRRAINRLRFLKTLDKKSFLNDSDKIGSAKYNFHGCSKNILHDALNTQTIC
jgi:hypothetical protein